MSGWRTETLGCVCEIYQPKTISQKEMSDDGDYSVFGANGQIGRYHSFNHEEPQLLITCRGATCGSVNISAPYSWITGNAMVVRPKSPELDLKFVEYFFRGAVDLDGVITGAAQPQITRKSLAPVEIPLPPLEVQKRIVAVLDKAFAALDRARANAEANLADAEELFENSIKSTFGDTSDVNHVALEECANIVSGYSFASGDFGAQNPVKTIKITNVGVKVFVETDTERLPEKFLSEFSRFSIPAGAIVIALTRSIISEGLKVAVVPESFSGALLNQRVAAVKVLNDVCLRDYLYMFLASPVVVKYVQEKANTLMQPNFSINDLRQLQVPLPEASKRQTLVRTLSDLKVNVTGLQRDYRERLQNIADLRQSLLQKAFAGELT